MLELNGNEQRPIAALINHVSRSRKKLTRIKIKYFSGPAKVRALKNETAKTTTHSTAETTKIGKGERGKTLLLQRFKELSDVTVIDCATVKHAPRRGIL